MGTRPAGDPCQEPSALSSSVERADARPAQAWISQHSQAGTPPGAPPPPSLPSRCCVCIAGARSNVCGTQLPAPLYPHPRRQRVPYPPPHPHPLAATSTPSSSRRCATRRCSPPTPRCWCCATAPLTSLAPSRHVAHARACSPRLPLAVPAIGTPRRDPEAALPEPQRGAQLCARTPSPASPPHPTQPCPLRAGAAREAHHADGGDGGVGEGPGGGAR